MLWANVPSWLALAVMIQGNAVTVLHGDVLGDQYPIFNSALPVLMLWSNAITTLRKSVSTAKVEHAMISGGARSTVEH